MLVRYFAGVREALSLAEETIAEPCGTVPELLRLLRARGEPWRSVLADESLLIAVNRTLAAPGQPLGAGDEVAIFPPVTGG